MISPQVTDRYQVSQVETNGAPKLRTTNSAPPVELMSGISKQIAASFAMAHMLSLKADAAVSWTRKATDEISKASHKMIPKAMTGVPVMARAI